MAFTIALSFTGGVRKVGALKYITQDLIGIGGKIKQSPEDFIVEEMLLYQPIGAGTHTYFEVEKRGITTLEAIRRIAHALGVSERAIGYAGLKDAQAVTKQMMSVEHIPCNKVLDLKLPGIKINWAKLQQNKLRIGHLWGNRFQLTIRNVKTNALARAQKIIAVLESKVVPNYFGEQGIVLNPDDAEALFVHGCTCYYLPSFFRRGDDAQRDFKKILRLLTAQMKDYDAELIHNALKFISEKAELDAKDRDYLRQINLKLSHR